MTSTATAPSSFTGLPTRADWLEIDGARLAYTETGAGEPVVAVHCSASNGAQWTPLAERISERFVTVAPDLHGSGRSEAWPGYRPLRLTDEAAVVHGLVERAERPVHLIGHSYGGGVALRAAFERPGQIASLVLIEPSAFHLLKQGDAEDRDLFAEIAAVAHTALRAVGEGDYHGGMGEFVDYWNVPGSFAAMSARRRSGLAQKLPRTAADFAALFGEETRLEDFAAALTMPVLILEGDRSPAPSRRICRMLEAALPWARLETVAGVGHMAPLTHPDRVNPIIEGFLAEVAEESIGAKAVAAGWLAERVAV